MTQATLVRQFIKDAAGQPVAVLLPIEEYALVRTLLERRDQELAAQMHDMQLAANDPLFLSDLRETMAAFEATDVEWWEHAA
jgi:hypothetical protein